MNSKVLIFASNLHSGGGAAVASSFIKELSLIIKDDAKWNSVYDLAISKVVFENLVSMNVDLTVFGIVKVQCVRGAGGLFGEVDKIIRGYQCVFTIFGPLYSIRKPLVNIVGFAQPWMIYPKSTAWSKLKYFDKLKLKLKFGIQKLFFSRADLLVVELPHVEQQLNEMFPHIPKVIVNSCIDSVYKRKEEWGDLELPVKQDNIKIGLISQNYTHKNIDFFGAVSKALQENGRFNVSFYVTLDSNGFNQLDSSTQKSVINVGPLKLNQCPSFYKEMDIILFPSVLECFSAVCVESLYMGKPLIANDLNFIKDVCKDSAFYIKEGDYEECSKVIELLINKDVEFDKDKAKELASSFGDSTRRAKEYISIIERYV